MKTEALGTRRKGRELALKVLYQMEFRPTWSAGEKEDFVLSDTGPTAVKQFARELVEGVQRNRTVLDETISRLSTAWKLDRIGSIERNIIRIGCYEILFGGDVPPAAAINEAIELAKQYGSVEAGPFVNGVLDAVRKQCSSKEQ
ncbi:MAG: transcription antitermination factor NusB [Planctomycetota bacterium]|nr:transcription antitermination factor NusB [Planctomycetota bacterium]